MMTNSYTRKRVEIFAEQTGDSVIELREKTKNLTIDEIMDQIS